MTLQTGQGPLIGAQSSSNVDPATQSETYEVLSARATLGSRIGSTPNSLRSVWDVRQLGPRGT